MNSPVKNKEYLADITDISENGEGIGHICEGEASGYTVFVKGALPGECVLICLIKVKKKFGYGRLIEVIRSSKDRREPVCPVARRCGGCQLQHLSYPAQLAFKEKKIRGCLQRIGGINLELEPIDAMEEPYRYRNKAQFPVGIGKEGNPVIGFYAGRTHAIIDTKSCCIQAEVNEIIMNQVREFMKMYQLIPYCEKTHTGLIRHILTRAGFMTGELMVCLVINGTSLPYSQEFIQCLLSLDLGGCWHIKSICINMNQEKTNVIMGSECRFLWGSQYITDYIGENIYRISPLSFFQVNPVQAKKLYDTALLYADLHGTETVWDLYCGTGTISLFLARKAARVYGVEVIPEAVQDARENAKMNHIENVEFFCGAAEEVMPAWIQEHADSKADVIVVDPPRKGCDAVLLDCIAAMEPDKVIYISCDPATLARDLKHLTGKGYQALRARGNDMFGNSVHIETVVLIQRTDT